MFRRLDGYWQWVAVDKDPAYEKRLKWIAACANISNARLHHFDYIKENTSRYFVEAIAIYVPKRYIWGWAMESKDLARPSCYYLGTYPNKWNVGNRRIVYPHDWMTMQIIPIGKAPSMYEEYTPDYYIRLIKEFEDKYGYKNLMDYFYPELILEPRRTAEAEQIKKYREEIDKSMDEFRFAYHPAEILTYVEQDWALLERQKRYKDCIARNFPKPPRKPQTKVSTPKGISEFPGIPMDQIEKPTPTSPPMAPPKLTLTISFSIKTGVSYNALELVLTIEQTTF